MRGSFSRSTPILRGRSQNLQPQPLYIQGELFSTVQKPEPSTVQTINPNGRAKSSNGRARKPELVIDTPAPYLQIESTPLSERIIPERHTYILVILPQGVRAAGGEYSAQEAHEIARATKGWDWADARSLARLEALLDGIIKRLAKGGES